MNTNDDGATAVADAQINETQTTNEQAEAPAAETKAKKKTKAAPVAATKINASMADKKAAADGIAQESDMTYSIPLTSLTANENPREEPSNLAAMGYKLIDSENPTQSLLHMCLSDDEDTLRAVVELFETHEGNDVVVADQAEPKADLSDVKAKETTLVKKSICSLALSIAAKQLQPVTVLRGGKRKDGGYNYTLVFGQRRTAAKLYAYAKSRVDKLDKVTDSQFKNVLPVITAVELNCSLEQAFEYAVAENMNRKDFTPIQEGRIYAAYMKRVNPTTGKKYNLKDITRHLYPQEGTAKYGHVRNRYALVMPYKADKVDDKGNITERGRGLTDEQRAEVEAGTKTLTWAIRTALREEHYNPEGTPQTTRRKPLPLKEIEARFDKTEEANEERRKALAECMGLTLKQATKESEKRIKEEEQKELAKNEKAKAAADKKAAKAAGKLGQKEENSEEAAQES